MPATGYIFVYPTVGDRENRTKVHDFVLNTFARSADGGPDTDKNHTHDVKWRRNLAAADNEATSSMTSAARWPDTESICRLRGGVDISAKKFKYAGAFV